MSQILLIQGHPDPDNRRFCRALALAYAEGAREAGHAVETIDLAMLEIPLLRTQADFETGDIPVGLQDAAQAIQRAHHVVLIFPLWLGTMPALVKAFLEQVMRPGVAFSYTERRFPERRLTGRSARIVVTMGMPAWIYRFWYGAHGLRGLDRSILRFVGLHPVRTTLFGGIGTANSATRKRWLVHMRTLGERAR